VDLRFDDLVPGPVHQPAEAVKLAGVRIAQSHLPLELRHDEVAALVAIGERHLLGEPDAVALGERAAAALDVGETAPAPVDGVFMRGRVEQRENPLGAFGLAWSGLIAHIFVPEN
jgi:hypothetical protein